MIEGSESEVNIAPLKSGPVSVIHACEPLAAGACRKRDLRDHLRTHQWPATQNSAVKSPGRRVVRRGTYDCDIQVGFWDYARFGVPITIVTTAAGVILLPLFR